MSEGRPPTTPNAEEAEFWASVAPTWLESEGRIEITASLPGRMAMDDLQLLPGAGVLDIGCGSGRTTVELAQRVGPTGRVLGVDIAEELLAAARQRASESDCDNVEFLLGDVQVHAFGESQFDAAFSRFGVMFFADPVVAFSNVRRGLRARARLSFACWQSVFENEWMLIPGAAAMSVVESPPPLPGPDEPGPFSFADPGRVRSVLTTAGFTRIEVRSHNDWVATPEDQIPAVLKFFRHIGLVAELMKTADEGTRRAILEAVEGALRDRVVDGEVRATRGFFIVTAEA